MPARNGRLPPAILLGGTCNALSVARSLGGAGVPVYALNSADAPVAASRYCRLIRPRGGWHGVASTASYLLGPESEPFRGAVVLACSDGELELIARNRVPLVQKFLLDLSDPQAQLAMLNKLDTYRRAEAAGVPLPRYWAPQAAEEVDALRDTLEYPVVVKPLYSHVFRQHFTQKLVVARDFDQVRKAFTAARAAGVDVMLVEMIPGPDDRLCSYYTYLDEAGRPLFHFTKRVIRRSPPIMGNGCYHITDRNPEVAELALRFFRAVGLRGLANAEFKRDERDGRLKLIECNARFTEANCLVAASGYDLARFVYNRLTGRPHAPFGTYKVGQRLWYPVEDFYAFLKLRQNRQLTLPRWLASLAHPKMLPFFRADDPRPSIRQELRRMAGTVGRRLRRLFRRAD